MSNKIYDITTTISSLINNETNIVKFINNNIPVLSTVVLTISNKTNELSSTIDTKFWTGEKTSGIINNILTGKLDLSHYIRNDKNGIISGTFTTTSGFYVNNQKIENITYEYIDNKFENIQIEINTLYELLKNT